MKLESQLHKIAKDKNTNFWGIADLSQAHDFINSQGGSKISKYPFAISVGISLFKDIVDQLPNRKERPASVAYKHHCYDIINSRLDLVISELSSYLQNQGFSVYPVPASQRTDDEKICGIFSHKLAAYLSGIGWIGKSCLLVTPEVGPRVRFATLLTNAPLKITGSPKADQCGECRECVRICPVQAFSGQPFKSNEGREIRYDAQKCDQYFKSIKKINDWSVCGMCVYICPHGTNKMEKKFNIS